jgi:hypothetical protein
MGEIRVVLDTINLRIDVVGASISKEASYWQYLVDRVVKGQFFTAHIYNKGGRVMVIKKVGK